MLARPDVVELRDRVKVVADPALGKQDADVEITLASGRTLATEVRGNRGTPAAPLDDDELGAKFRELVGPVLGRRAHRAAAGHLLAGRRASRRLGAAAQQTVPAGRWLTSPWSPAPAAVWVRSSPNALREKDLRWR